jgi:hypothetical protein
VKGKGIEIWAPTAVSAAISATLAMSAAFMPVLRSSVQDFVS